MKLNILCIYEIFLNYLRELKNSEVGIVTIVLFTTPIILSLISIIFASDLILFMVDNFWKLILIYMCIFYIVSSKDDGKHKGNTGNKFCIAVIPLLILWTYAGDIKGEKLISIENNVKFGHNTDYKGKVRYCNIYNEDIRVSTNNHIDVFCGEKNNKFNVELRQSRLGFYKFKYICKNNICLNSWNK